MRVGDILEILGAAAFVVAAYLKWGEPAALAVAGVALVYEAQCWGTQPLPQPRLPRFLKRKKAEPEVEASG